MTFLAKIPISIRILLTSKCNLRCSFCLADAGDGKRKNELKSADWLAFFDRLKELNVFNITLSGGEVFLRNDIFELLNKLKNSRLHKVSILSNGTLITEEVAKRLDQLNIRSVAISIDGLEESHDSIRGKGSFGKAVDGIQHLMAAGIIPQVSFTPTRDNYSNFGRLVDFLVSLGIKSVQVNTLSPKGRCFNIYKCIALRYPSEVADFLETVDRKREEYHDVRITCEFGFYHNLPKSYEYYLRNPQEFRIKHLKDGCSAASTSCTVTPNGDVIPCEGFPDLIGGNVLKRDLLDIWTNSPNFELIRNLGKLSMAEVPKCKNCRYIYLCDAGCRANAYSVYHDLLAPDILCPYWKDSQGARKGECSREEP